MQSKDVIQSNHRELKRRTELLVKNIKEVRDLIRTRSDLRFILKTFTDLEILENGSSSGQQGGQDAGIPSNEEADRAGN